MWLIILICTPEPSLRSPTFNVHHSCTSACTNHQPSIDLSARRENRPRMLCVSRSLAYITSGLLEFQIRFSALSQLCDMPCSSASLLLHSQTTFVRDEIIKRTHSWPSGCSGVCHSSRSNCLEADCCQTCQYDRNRRWTLQ